MAGVGPPPQQQPATNDSVNAVTIQSTTTAAAAGSGAASSSRHLRQQRQHQQHSAPSKQSHQHHPTHSHGQKFSHHASATSGGQSSHSGAAVGGGGAVGGEVRSGSYDYDTAPAPHVHYHRSAGQHAPPPAPSSQSEQRPCSPPVSQQSQQSPQQHPDRHYPPTHSPPLQQVYAQRYRPQPPYYPPPHQGNFHYYRSATGHLLSTTVNSVGPGHQSRLPHSSYHLHQAAGSGLAISGVSGAGLGAGASSLDVDTKKIVTEFSQLLEKSKQLFNGLRDLPQYGNKHWQVYFGRTFDIYTRLWRFQQQHRQILDNQLGLKRWQIGEIASKIGQLYYHYYLRTSDTGFLLEAFSFYAAIRSRQYYSKATREERPELMVKKLRYYARFILVCLLLKKLKLVRDLIRELSRQIDEYVNAYDPEDQLEWSLVLTEIKSFVEADNIVNIVDVDSSTVILSHRLTPYNTPPLERGVPATLALQEALIVGNTYDQVKFSDVTLDMFWMIQALEREPHEDLLNSSSRAADSSPAPGKTPYDEPNQSTKQNPHKYLLYKPTFSQFSLFVSSALKETPNNGAILLYISADGAFETMKRAPTPHHAYDLGGVATNSRRENGSSLSSASVDPKSKTNPNHRDMHCVYPGDLYPFLRRPLFCIIDSDNSSVFMGMPKLFGQPLIVLTSPVDVPPFLHEQPQRGSLFTLFLHSPLTAFCYVCNIGVVPIAVWDKCQAHIDKFICEAGRLLVRTSGVDHSYVDFYGDDFLRLILLRFIFCHCVLRLHRSFRGNPVFHPHCHPLLPDAELLQHPTLIRLVLDLACILDVMSAFRDSEETVC